MAKKKSVDEPVRPQTHKFMLTLLGILIVCIILILVITAVAQRNMPEIVPSTFNTTLDLKDMPVQFDLADHVELHVYGTDMSQLEISASGDNIDVDRIRVEQRNGKIYIEQRSGRSLSFWDFTRRRTPFTMVVKIPSNTPLTMDISGHAEMYFHNIHTSLHLENSGHSILQAHNSTFTNTSLQISGHAEIELDRCSGNLRVETAGHATIRANHCALEKLYTNIHGHSEITLHGSVKDADINVKGHATIVMPEPERLREAIYGRGDISYTEE